MLCSVLEHHLGKALLRQSHLALNRTIITERSVGTLWQSGSPKRLWLGLILALRQVASSLWLGTEWPAKHTYAEVALRSAANYIVIHRGR